MSEPRGRAYQKSTARTCFLDLHLKALIVGIPKPVPTLRGVAHRWPCAPGTFDPCATFEVSGCGWE